MRRHHIVVCDDMVMNYEVHPEAKCLREECVIQKPGDVSGQVVTFRTATGRVHNVAYANLYFGEFYSAVKVFHAQLFPIQVTS